MRRQSSIVFIIISLIVSPWNLSFGQEAGAVNDVAALTLKDEMRRSEQKLISLFNSQNKIRRFNIRCQKMSMTGSHISKRVCAPAFMFQSFGQYGSLLAAGFNILTDEVNWSSSRDGRIREFSMAFTDVMFRDTEFTYALLEFTQLNAQYDQVSNPLITLR